MNSRIKALWITNLKYYTGKVAKFGMRNNQTYDALGLLCNLATKELYNLKWELNPTNAGYYVMSQHLSDLPDRVKQWADLPCNSPKLTYRGIITPIHRLSDNGISLSIIANLIEEQY